MSTLRTIAEPFVVAPPAGARVRTRLRVPDADAAVLREAGEYLGSLGWLTGLPGARKEGSTPRAGPSPGERASRRSPRNRPPDGPVRSPAPARTPTGSRTGTCWPDATPCWPGSTGSRPGLLFRSARGPGACPGYSTRAERHSKTVRVQALRTRLAKVDNSLDRPCERMPGRKNPTAQAGQPRHCLQATSLFVRSAAQPNRTLNSGFSRRPSQEELSRCARLRADRSPWPPACGDYGPVLAGISTSADTTPRGNVALTHARDARDDVATRLVEREHVLDSLAQYTQLARAGEGKQPDSLGHMPVVPGVSRARRAVAAMGSVLHPDGYHGAHERAGFFEGWYVKLVSGDRSARIAVIPGIFLGLADSAGRHDEAFVQVLDGITGRSWYERYDASDFHAETDRFDVTIGPNRFSAEGVQLDLPESGLSGRASRRPRPPGGREPRRRRSGPGAPAAEASRVRRPHPSGAPRTHCQLQHHP